MARKLGQIITRGQNTWLVRIDQRREGFGVGRDQMCQVTAGSKILCQ